MKHAASSDWTPIEKRDPKHSKGWARDSRYEDACHLHTASIPGKHAKPFAKHHPATPVTYDGTGTTTPLVAAAPVLDVVA